MSSITLQEGEQRLFPTGQSFSVFAMHHGFMADIVSDIGQIDSAASVGGCLQEDRNVRMFHETITSSGTPEIRGDLFNHEPFSILDPRHRLCADRQHEQ